jgi:antitoxin ParD1/3/4
MIDKVSVYHDRAGNTLTVRRGRVIGFERLNYLSRKQRGRGKRAGRSPNALGSRFAANADVRPIAMGRTLNVSLTDELRAFVDQNSGDGTLYATPSEFVRDVLREKKARLEAAAIRDAILEGYQDAVRGRTVPFRGDLRAVLKKAGD